MPGKKSGFTVYLINRLISDFDFWNVDRNE